MNATHGHSHGHHVRLFLWEIGNCFIMYIYIWCNWAAWCSLPLAVHSVKVCVCVSQHYRRNYVHDTWHCVTNTKCTTKWDMIYAFWPKKGNFLYPFFFCWRNSHSSTDEWNKNTRTNVSLPSFLRRPNREKRRKEPPATAGSSNSDDEDEMETMWRRKQRKQIMRMNERNDDGCWIENEIYSTQYKCKK